MLSKVLVQHEELIDLTKPNNILGFQYVTAAEKQQAALKMATIQRKNADYHDEEFTSSPIASATSIRKALFSQGSENSSIASYVPEYTYKMLLHYHKTFGSFHHWDNYWPFIKLVLLQTNAEDLKQIYEMEEGLENRFLASALKAETFPQFMNEVKTKRYTWTRLQRALTHVLTRTTKEDLTMKDEKVTYLRLLGMTDNGRAYLNRYKKDILSSRSLLSALLLMIHSFASIQKQHGFMPWDCRKNTGKKQSSWNSTQQPIYLAKK